MDKRQRDSFRMYQIEATANDFLPGIPMHHPILYELEKESEFECESLTVKFDQWKGQYQSNPCSHYLINSLFRSCQF